MDLYASARSREERGRKLKRTPADPMLGAQWINCQYLGSTIDNDVYGAGDKSVHNVLGGFGVVRGNGWAKLIVIDPANGHVSRWTAGDELIGFSDAPTGWAEPRTMV